MPFPETPPPGRDNALAAAIGSCTIATVLAPNESENRPQGAGSFGLGPCLTFIGLCAGVTVKPANRSWCEGFWRSPRAPAGGRSGRVSLENRMRRRP